MTDMCPVHDRPWWKDAGALIEGFDAPHCSWDGSLHPDVFMELVERGATLTPTDKNYKVYIEMDEVDDGRGDDDVIRGSTNAKENPYPGRWVPLTDEIRARFDERDFGDHTTFVEIEKRGNRRHDKFYFEHLSEEQRRRFIELLNEGKLKLKYPGHFYRLPFFISRGEHG